MKSRLALTAVLMVLPVLPSAAGDFRITTKVFNAQDDKRPISENLTLFHRGVVYDFLSQPKTVTIFHPPMGGAPGRFIVLDRSRSIKLEVTTDQTQGVLTKLKDWAAGQEDEYLQFLAEPNFVEAFSAGENTLTLSSDHMNYKLRVTKPSDDEALEAYRQFSDWYARFNALNAGGGMLPFPRMAVNEALYRRKCIPTEVTLKVPAQKLEMRSEHLVTWRISVQDRKLIEEALEQMGSFLKVGPEEFLHGRTERVANASPAAE